MEQELREKISNEDGFRTLISDYLYNNYNIESAENDAEEIIKLIKENDWHIFTGMQLELQKLSQPNAVAPVNEFISWLKSITESLKKYSPVVKLNVELEVLKAVEDKFNSLFNNAEESKQESDVYSRPECVFKYCPHPEKCKSGNECLCKKDKLTGECNVKG